MLDKIVNAAVGLTRRKTGLTPVNSARGEMSREEMM
jgi:hypothetical protein